MIIIKKYILKETSKEEYKVLSREEKVCPICKSKLTPIGSRIRITYLISGKRVSVRIRRLRCTNKKCYKIHHELPDMLVPFKRYELSAIYSIISGKENQVGCDEKTIREVHRWWKGISNYGQTIKTIKDFKEFIHDLYLLFL